MPEPLAHVQWDEPVRVKLGHGGRWTLDIGRWTLDIGRWTLAVGQMDVGRWTLDVGGRERWTWIWTLEGSVRIDGRLANPGRNSAE